MRSLSLFVLLVALATAGCATPLPSQAAIDAADFGPAPVSFRSEIREAVSRRLLHPASAQLRFAEPRRAVVENGDADNGFGGGWVAGWIVPLGVKALGADGEFTGHVPEIYFFPAGGGVFRLSPEQTILPAAADADPR